MMAKKGLFFERFIHRLRFGAHCIGQTSHVHRSRSESPLGAPSFHCQRCAPQTPRPVLVAVNCPLVFFCSVLVAPCSGFTGPSIATTNHQQTGLSKHGWGLSKRTKWDRRGAEVQDGPSAWHHHVPVSGGGPCTCTPEPRSDGFWEPETGLWIQQRRTKLPCNTRGSRPTTTQPAPWHSRNPAPTLNQPP